MDSTVLSVWTTLNTKGYQEKVKLVSQQFACYLAFSKKEEDSFPAPLLLCGTTTKHNQLQDRQLEKLHSAIYEKFSFSLIRRRRLRAAEAYTSLFMPSRLLRCTWAKYTRRCKKAWAVCNMMKKKIQYNTTNCDLKLPTKPNIGKLQGCFKVKQLKYKGECMTNILRPYTCYSKFKVQFS